ncbi:transmembrane protein, putative [Medicago truncatula]|uniref:Transmembrane protein, putative n=1 Tax=Medicago truncatula TaxID=3880 RepID=G7J583_MEDTR|nr:transmembrane protein, putative [Medicago truncatula]
MLPYYSYGAKTYTAGRIGFLTTFPIFMFTMLADLSSCITNSLHDPNLSITISQSLSWRQAT